MATTQTLKKKLHGVRSIQKVSKALKTASTVKLSQISSQYSNYAFYANRCKKLYEDNRTLFERAMPKANEAAPVCFVVMAGNKGMCGSFNSDLLSFALERIQTEKTPLVILVGHWLKAWFDESQTPYRCAFTFDDIPSYDDTCALHSTLQTLIAEGEVSSVELIYPQYRNMMKQEPVCRTFRASSEDGPSSSNPLFFPDRESVVYGMADRIMTAFLHETVLECALGSQAATLMTMRSAYDTATEYGEQLESEINQQRQSRVTADVLETSSEFSMEVTDHA